MSTTDPNATIFTKSWHCDGHHFSECILSEPATGTVDDAIEAARKMLREDDESECREITSVSLRRYWCGGTGGWGYDFAGVVTRRDVRLRDGYTTSKRWPRITHAATP